MISYLAILWQVIKYDGIIIRFVDKYKFLIFRHEERTVNFRY